MTDIHILVVDDDLVNRENISHVLEKDGYFVQKAVSGEEALQKLQAHRFDLVITDMKMAEVDGLQVMTAVKDMAPTPRLSSSPAMPPSTRRWRP
ncbi:hypothetical protein GF1_10710 [Desulfolithobacter dissulfuricans]|uniref:Response regulatory domain-containing protein n=1 Tax=Desulfolithobacter dissulfuricans TaxID=2795293 RepID=A0A915XI19_9BACT|nr:response regulator [Desulfolithobacter dissulfuricans]BCO08695.1 hypothetical protein GF1_10710 [Desulfolithobacter dissulfuricans]